jgi:hypothetical protein
LLTSVALGQRQQFLVRRAPVEEERQSRRQFHVGDRVHAAGRKAGGRALGAIEELGAGEDGRQRIANGGVEVADAPGGAIKRERRLEVRIGDRTPVRLARQRRQDAPRARKLLALVGRPADEHARPARCVAHAGRVERPLNLEAADARNAVLARRWPERMQDVVGLRVGPRDEGRAHFVRSRCHLDRDIQESRVDRRHGRCLLLIDCADVLLTANRVLEHLHAVDRHDERVAIFHAADVAGNRHVRDIQLVVAISGEQVFDDQSAASAERQPFDAHGLIGPACRPIGHAARARRWIADCARADNARR